MARLARLWLILGLFCPPLLLCGFRFVRAPNQQARFFGVAALLSLLVEVTIGLVVWAKYWRSDSWSGQDPTCVQYSYGNGNTLYMNNPVGSAVAIQGISPGATIVTNVSLYTLNCFYAGQMVVDQSPTNQQPKTIVVRVMTPGTFGDDIGLYVRPLQAKINPTASDAVTPSLSWLSFSDPSVSNPRATVTAGRRPPCLPTMCSGVYGQAQIGGGIWEARAQSGWFKYYYLIGVAALQKGALERPFCVDTCVLLWTKDASGNYVEPCVGVSLEACRAASTCSLVTTRNQCLGISA